VREQIDRFESAAAAAHHLAVGSKQLQQRRHTTLLLEANCADRWDLLLPYYNHIYPSLQQWGMADWSSQAAGLAQAE
jgi:hypothetical protein